MPNCFKHEKDGITIEWEVGVDCPLCSALDERAILQERLDQALEELKTIHERFQDIMEEAAASAPSIPANKRRRGPQAPTSRNVYEDLADLDEGD